MDSSQQALMTMTMKERMEKHKSLRQQMDKSKQANGVDLMSGHQQSKVRPKEEAVNERLRAEANKLVEQQEAEETVKDYESEQVWDCSVGQKGAGQERVFCLPLPDQRSQAQRRSVQRQEKQTFRSSSGSGTGEDNIGDSEQTGSDFIVRPTRPPF